jgi:hypothetical protein
VAEPAPDQKTLAAIEDFLERTQQYRQPSAPIVGAPQPPANRPVTPRQQESPPPPKVAVTDAGKPEPPKAPENRTMANAELAAAAPADPQPVRPVPAVERVTIQWDQRAEADEAPVRANAANTPMTAATGGPEPAAEKMLDELEENADARKDFESSWRLKLAQLALGQDATATAKALVLPAESAVLLSALVDAAIAVRIAASDPLDDGNAALAKIDSLRATAASRADPTVSGVALCRKVLTFGVYEEMPPDEFISGRTIQLIVYSEIGNFRSRKTDEGAYETQLATRLEVFTKAGESVWQRDEPEVVDACRNLRRDFFIAQRVTIPPTLPAGEYVLKVRVEDKLASKAGEAVKPFTIHSPISVAKKP